MSSRKRSTMKATVAPCAGGTLRRDASPASRGRALVLLLLTAAFDTRGASDIVLQSSYTHSPPAGSEGSDAGGTPC